jgi:hypothetical protein
MVGEGQYSLNVCFLDSSLVPLQHRQGPVVTQAVTWFSITATLDVIGEVPILHPLESLPKVGDAFLDWRD